MPDLKMSDEMRRAIMDDCRSDAAKITEFIEEKEIERKADAKRSRFWDFVIGFLSGIAATAAAEFLLPLVRQWLR